MNISKDRSIVQTRRENKQNLVLWIMLTAFYAASAVLYLPGYGNIILIGSAVLIFAWNCILFRGEVVLKFTKFHAFFLFFSLFIGVSGLWAVQRSYSLNRFYPSLYILMYYYFFYTCYDVKDKVQTLLRSLMWVGYIIMFYVVAFYGLNGVIDMLQNDMRMDNEAGNANIVGMMVSYSIIINIYFIITEKKLHIADILILPAIAMIALSGSRKSLLLLIGGVFLLFIMRNWNNKSVAISIFRVLFWVAVLVGVFILLLQMPFMTLIRDRMTGLFEQLQTDSVRVDRSAYTRQRLIELGWELFKEHPLLGVGMDNPRLFSEMYIGADLYLHNNFVELLAGGGIVGFISYYWFFIYLLWEFIKGRKYRDAQYDICLILLVLSLILHYAMVAYDMKPMYAFIMLYYFEVEHLNRQRSEKIKTSAEEKTNGLIEEA